MKKALYLLNSVLVFAILLFLIFFSGYPFAEAQDFNSFLNIYLKTFLVLSALYSLLIILSFFKSNKESVYYIFSSVMTIFVIIMMGISLSIFRFFPPTDNMLIAGVVELFAIFSLVLSPIIFVTSFILFLIAYFKKE